MERTEMRMINWAAVGFLVWATVLPLGRAEAGLLINGDFETGDLTGWTFTPAATADPGMVADVAAFDGSQAFRVNTGNSFPTGTAPATTLSQSVFLIGGVTYEVFADIAIENLDDRSGFLVEGGVISVSIGSLVIGQVGDPDFGVLLEPLEIIRESFSGLFTPVTSQSYAFQVEFGRRFPNTPPIVYHYADNLVVHELSLPEPDSLALLGVGLAGLGLAARRKRLV